MTEQAFWIPGEDGRFRATLHTQGPWSPEFQHGGPPAALLVRQMERCSPRPDMMLARVTIDILGPVPIALLSAQARVVRTGRSVEMLEATLIHEERPVMRAISRRVRLPNQRPPADEPVIPPALPGPESLYVTDRHCGYFSATEWRVVTGSYQHGKGTVWMHQHYPLVANEEPSSLQRLVLAADSANGISSRLDIEEWQFIPTELTIHCLRVPRGEWVCLDAVTHLQAEGVGLTTADIYDQDGLVGRSAQSLFIANRSPL